MTAKTQLKPVARPTVRLPLPDAHADVALGDINDLRALTRMSASWIHDAVRTRRFPAPVIREPRCTRWRIADVRQWLIERSAQGAADVQMGNLVTAKAEKASAAARLKRVANLSPTRARSVNE